MAAIGTVSSSGDGPKKLGKELPIFIVDAFSGGPFTGNPAAVCLIGDEVNLINQSAKFGPLFC